MIIVQKVNFCPSHLQFAVRSEGFLVFALLYMKNCCCCCCAQTPIAQLEISTRSYSRCNRSRPASDRQSPTYKHQILLGYSVVPVRNKAYLARAGQEIGEAFFTRTQSSQIFESGPHSTHAKHCRQLHRHGLFSSRGARPTARSVPRHTTPLHVLGGSPPSLVCSSILSRSTSAIYEFSRSFISPHIFGTDKISRS